MMIEWRLGFNPAAIIGGPVVNLTPYNKFVIRIDVIPAIRRKLAEHPSANHIRGTSEDERYDNTE